MGKKEIAVLAKSPAAVKFLDAFFRGNPKFQAHFFKDPGLFLNYISGNPPSAIVSESSLLSTLSRRKAAYPFIAVLGAALTKADASVIRRNTAHYISPPYRDIDLAFRLDAAISEWKGMKKLGDEIRGLKAVVEFIQMILTTLNPNELLFKIVEKIADIIPVTRCSIIRLEKDCKSAFVVASYEDRCIRGIRLDLRKYPEIREALATKKPVLVRNVTKNPLMRDVKDIIGSLGIHSILVVPILFQSQIIGTLFLRTSRAGHSFSRDEIRSLHTIANAASQVLNNAFLLEQVEDERSRLEKLSITDYLTGLYNTRYFFHRLSEEFSRSQRYLLPISCIMLDLDNFKAINDLKGHKAGDTVLREFAGILKNNMRRSDLLARYGGDEFIVMLPHTGLEGALAEAERVLSQVKSHRFKGLENMPAMTTSIGIAIFPGDNISNHNDLVALADAALLQAKERGKNQIAVYGGQPGA
ncbi:MAG: diguanylate cyclase [Nitrospirota bacterium]|nr:diguanylate cyclase [Nitrospirota bacterium]